MTIGGKALNNEQDAEAELNKLSYISRVLGILSVFICCPIFGIPAIIIGHYVLKRTKGFPKHNKIQLRAHRGLIAGYISIAFFILGVFFVRDTTKVPEKAISLSCASNLKEIGVVICDWASNHNGLLPTNLLEMTNGLYNPKILICPSDNFKKPDLWSPTNISYEFLTPGAALNSVSNRVIVRCPIHGNELFGDGMVKFQTNIAVRR